MLYLVQVSVLGKKRVDGDSEEKSESQRTTRSHRAVAGLSRGDKSRRSVSQGLSISCRVSHCPHVCVYIYIYVSKVGGRRTRSLRGV